MAKRRKHLICPVAIDGYHVWFTPEGPKGLGSMFAECRSCGAVLWTPKMIMVSDPHRHTYHPMAKRVFPQEGFVCPQHITGDVEATPNERDYSDASEPEV